MKLSVKTEPGNGLIIGHAAALRLRGQIVAKRSVGSIELAREIPASTVDWTPEVARVSRKKNVWTLSLIADTETIPTIHGCSNLTMSAMTSAVGTVRMRNVFYFRFVLTQIDVTGWR